MKVKDLITELQKFAPETLVLVEGYEGGFDETIVKEKTVRKTDDVRWYYGIYEESNNMNSLDNINAIVFLREKDDEDEENNGNN